MTESARELYGFELEPEVRDWLDSLSDSDCKRVDRAVRAQKTCESDHHGRVTQTCERQV